MKLKELIQDLDVRSIQADPETEIGGICCDSRAVRPGDLFVAVRGKNTDGHVYIQEVLEKGAAAVLCEEAPPAPAPVARNKTHKMGKPACPTNL